MTRWLVGFGFAALGFVGCVPTVPDDLSTIGAPRLLAVESLPAEAAPPETVTLRALVAAEDGAAPETVDWSMCVDRKPLTELGPVNSSCLRPTTDPSVEKIIGAGLDVATSLPSDGCSLFGPDPPPASVGEPAGRPADPDATGGYYQPVVAFLGGLPSLAQIRLDCGLSGVDHATLLDYQARYRHNENPAITELSIVDGASAVEIPPGATAGASVSRGVSVSLRASWAACPRRSVCGDGVCGENEDGVSCPADCTTPHGCAGAETYPFYDPATQAVVDRREAVTVSWYATKGDFTGERTGVAESDPDVPSVRNTWRAPSEAGHVSLWAVIRDDRGGVSWETYTLAVGD